MCLADMTENLLEWQLKDGHLKWYQISTSMQLSPAVEVSPISFLPVSVAALSTHLSSFLPTTLEAHKCPFSSSNQFQGFPTISFIIITCSILSTQVTQFQIFCPITGLFSALTSRISLESFSKLFCSFFQEEIFILSSFFLNLTNYLRA